MCYTSREENKVFAENVENENQSKAKADAEYALIKTQKLNAEKTWIKLMSRNTERLTDYAITVAKKLIQNFKFVRNAIVDALSKALNQKRI